MATNSDIERMVKEQLVHSEIRRIKEKLRPIVRAELEARIKNKDFKKNFSRIIRSQLADILSDDWTNFIPRKTWNRLMARAAKSIIR